MRHERVELIRLVASAQPRPLVTEAVDKLAASIREVGLIQPITVRSCSLMPGGLAGQGYQIVAGHHRVAACRALGWVEIDAIVVDAADHLTAELLEIDENLCRSELTASQRASAIKRRKAIWEALHPEGGRISPTPGGDQKIGFATDTASVSGESKRRINEHLARAEALGDDLQKVEGTSLDKGVELDALAKLPEPKRAELIERAQAGEKVTAREKPKQEAARSDESVELRAMLAEQASQFEETLAENIALQKVVDADDKLAEAMAQIKQLTAENQKLRERINGLTNEAAEAKKLAKFWRAKAERAEKAAA